MNASEKRNLQVTACKIRMGIIESTHAAKCGHPGSAITVPFNSNSSLSPNEIFISVFSTTHSSLQKTATKRRIMVL